MARKADPKISFLKNIDKINSKINQSKKALTDLESMVLELKMQFDGAFHTEPVPQVPVTKTKIKGVKGGKTAVKSKVADTTVTITPKAPAKRGRKPAKKN